MASAQSLDRYSLPCGCVAHWWRGLTGKGEWNWVTCCSRHAARLMDPELCFPYRDDPTRGVKRVGL